MSDSQIVNKDGIEYPTHTTSHNQVTVAKVAAPRDDVMDNYLALKRERDMSWDDVASLASSQDPLLADHLREAGPAYEKAQDDAEADNRELLTELAVNPLITQEQRDAHLSGADPVFPADSEQAPDNVPSVKRDEDAGRAPRKPAAKPAAK